MANPVSKCTLPLLLGGVFILGSTGLTRAADPIRIGAPLSLTGSLADEGGKEQQGLDMCITAVNAKGGVKVGSDMRKLEAVKYDYQSETSRAVQIVQRLLTVDKVAAKKAYEEIVAFKTKNLERALAYPEAKKKLASL